MVESAHIAVMCAVRCSLKSVNLHHTNMYIVVSAHIVMCTVRRSLKKVILYHTNVYIVESARIAVMCAVRHSFIRVI